MLKQNSNGPQYYNAKKTITKPPQHKHNQGKRPKELDMAGSNQPW